MGSELADLKSTFTQLDTVKCADFNKFIFEK